MLRAGIADVSGIVNIADIADVADLSTDIADIVTGITDVVDSADIADRMLRTLRWKQVDAYKVSRGCPVTASSNSLNKNTLIVRVKEAAVAAAVLIKRVARA